MLNSYHIFLLSHMRANTSLISHILGSHPQINGYYESHQSYLNEEDLIKQINRQDIGTNVASDSSKRFYHSDKLLHNKYQLKLPNLAPNCALTLVSIRPPSQTIKSIVHLFKQKRNNHPYSNVAQASQYYIERVAELANFCSQNKAQYFYFDAQLIKSQSLKLLSKLQIWLSLASPLNETYQVFYLTGKERMGDSSENIKTGRIIQSTNTYHEISIPKEILSEVATKTENYRAIMLENVIEFLIE